ncbi:MAG: BREX system serine/threonine kinase PglW, partial [Methylococcus sp.]
GPARENVYLRGDLAAEIFDETPPTLGAQPIDRDLATSINRALETIGIRPPQRSRRVGDYRLEQLLAETDFHQDWLARHVSLGDIARRIRLYTTRRSLRAEQRETLADAARREFQLLEGIRHPGILRAADFIDSEQGPALIFDHDPAQQRLDHFIRAHADALDLWQRLKLVRAIAEVLDAAHRHRLYHRGLSPQTILVRPQSEPTFDVTLFDWQIATRQLRETEATSTGALHREMLSDRTAQDIYLAPEARIAPKPDAIKLDLFALGAIAYFVLSGEPPALDGDDLVAKCEQGPGLNLSAHINGCLAELEELIQFATWPSTEDRFGTTGEFLAALGKAEEALEEDLTAPTSGSPLDANAGTHLNGFEVLRRLGKGGTCLALEVRRTGPGQPRQGVLKVALEPEFNDRLKQEAALLANLHHQNIVQCHERFEIAGLSALFLSSGGEETLADRLRQERRLGLDLLQRFGEELIGVVDYLERENVFHRDIKPDNIGIRLGAGRRLALTLFDFSLAGIPMTELHVGTRGYLDPFLRRRGRWDGYAERFACAATLYEMATGERPQWGDGSADPATLETEITLDPDRFDTSIRDRATRFFAQALARDHHRRFDHAEQMLRAWRHIFETIGRPVTAHGEAPTQAVIPFLEPGGAAPPAITPTTPIESLELDSRQLQLLEKIGRDELVTAGDLAELPRNRFYRHRGFALAVARELHQLADRLRGQFNGAPVEEESVPEPVLAKLSVDAAAALLVPRKGEPAQLQALHDWLRQSGPDGGTVLPPEQLEGMTERLARLPEITHLREDIAQILAGLGGLATVNEVAAALLARRGSVKTGAARSQEALALARALLAVERSRSSPRWQVVTRAAMLRPGGEAAEPWDLVIVVSSAGVGGESHPTPEQRAAYALSLGEMADGLAAQDPLPSPQHVAEALARLPLPSGEPPLPPERRLRLAAACATTAALSSRLEFYPRQLPPDRALKLAANALVGLPRLSVDIIQRRVHARYPEAAPLPPASLELERLLREAAGLAVVWDPDTRVFLLDASDHHALSTTTRLTLQTGSGQRRRPSSAPDVQAARQLEARIQGALTRRKLLTLSVDPKDLMLAQRVLAQRFALTVIDLDALVLTELEAQAREWEIDWNVLLAADAAPPGSVDARNFATVLAEVWPRVESALLQGAEPGLLVNVGLAARWQRLALFARLQNACLFEGRAPLIVLIGSAMTPDNRPVLDGQAVPVTINTTDYGRITRAWLDNAHNP